MWANLLQRLIPMKIELKLVEAKEQQKKPNNKSRANDNDAKQYPNPYNLVCNQGTAVDWQCTRWSIILATKFQISFVNWICDNATIISISASISTPHHAHAMTNSIMSYLARDDELSELTVVPRILGYVMRHDSAAVVALTRSLYVVMIVTG